MICRNFSKKSGFTLMEVMAAIGLVSLIVLTAIPLFSHRDFNKRLYYSTFKAVKQATGAIYVNNNKVMPAGATKYCFRFAEIVNNIYEDLDDDGTPEIDQEGTGTNEDDMGCYISDWNEDDDASRDRPNIILPNGVRLYGMEQDFSSDTCSIIQVDIDGRYYTDSDNNLDKDVLGIRVCKDGYVSAEGPEEEAILNKYADDKEKDAWNISPCTLTSDGVDSFIDTGITTGPNIKVEVKARYIEPNAADNQILAKVFGYVDNVATIDSHYFMGYRNAEAEFYYAAGASHIVPTGIGYDDKIHIFTMDAPNDKVLIDNVDVTAGTAFVTGGDLYIFDQGGAVNTQARSKVELYYAKIWKDGELVRYYVPNCSAQTLEDLTTTDTDGDNSVNTATLTTNGFAVSSAFKYLRDEL